MWTDRSGDIRIFERLADEVSSSTRNMGVLHMLSIQ